MGNQSAVCLSYTNLYFIPEKFHLDTCFCTCTQDWGQAGRYRNRIRRGKWCYVTHGPSFSPPHSQLWQVQFTLWWNCSDSWYPSFLCFTYLILISSTGAEQINPERQFITINKTLKSINSAHHTYALSLKKVNTSSAYGTVLVNR